MARQVAEWPLVGRDAELGYCRELVAAGQGLLLAGRAGVGKSRLAREVLGELGDGVVRSAVATASARDVPFGAFAHLGSGSFDPQRFTRELQQAVERDERVVLSVDDAHSLDERSAALLVTLQQCGVALVLTVRTGEPTPDAVQLLWKDEYVHRVDIQPLSRAETEALLTAVLGGPIAPSAVDRLFTATDGNPLY